MWLSHGTWAKDGLKGALNERKREQAAGVAGQVTFRQHSWDSRTPRLRAALTSDEHLSYFEWYGCVPSWVTYDPYRPAWKLIVAQVCGDVRLVGTGRFRNHAGCPQSCHRQAPAQRVALLDLSCSALGGCSCASQYPSRCCPVGDLQSRLTAATPRAAFRTVLLYSTSARKPLVVSRFEHPEHTCIWTISIGGSCVLFLEVFLFVS